MPKNKTQAEVFRPLSALLIAGTVGLFLAQGLLWPKPAFSAGFKPNIFENEFGPSLNALSSERLGDLLTIPPFDPGISFWLQIGNPHRITTDLETFYSAFNQITLSEIKESYFHGQLMKIRDFEFLKLYFNAKFDGASQAPKPEPYTGHRSSAFYSAQASGAFYNPPGERAKRFLKPLSAALENKDLNAIKNWVLNTRLTLFEKSLVAIVLIHTGDFNDHIFDFIQEIGLDLNQAVRAEGFIGVNMFSALEPEAFVTSLAYEILATLNPAAIEKLLSDPTFKFEGQNPLQESPLHFFVRSAAKPKAGIDQRSLAQACLIALERLYPLIEKSDLFGFNPLMIAARRLHEPFINQSFELLRRRPEQSEAFVRAFLKKDPYGRSLADIAHENGYAPFASRIAYKITQTILLNQESSNLQNHPLFIEHLEYAGKKGPGGSNRLPYIRMAPALFYYIEGLRINAQNGFIDINESFLDHIAKRHLMLSDIWELYRQYVVASLMREPDFFTVFAALQKRSRSAIDNLSQDIKNLLQYSFYLTEVPSHNKKPEKFSLQYENYNNKALPQGQSSIRTITHFLNEAIMHHSVGAVSWLLENHFDKQWFQEFVEGRPAGRTFLIDPLSLALLAYVSLPEEDKERKASARQIIRLVAEYQDPSKTPNGSIAIAPMGWALSLGLLDEVRFFHEEKQIPIPSSIKIIFSSEGRELDIETSIALSIAPFLRLREYVAPKLQLGEGEDSCLRAISQ